MKTKWMLFFMILISCSSPTEELVEVEAEKEETGTAVEPPETSEPTDASETPSDPDAALALEEIKEVTTQSTYSQEIDGAPARPTWVDAFRYYPEAEFLKKGRYLLVWRKDPGERATPATRFELHQILFKDPTAMSQPENFGKPIDPNTVESTHVISNENDPKVHPEGLVTLPSDLLKPDVFSTDSSENYPSFVVDVADNTQVGYYPLTIADNSRQLVVAYKVRAYASAKDTDDKGNITDIELYNDSPVMYVNYKMGTFIQVTESGTGGNGGLTSSEHIADEIVSMEALRNELGYGENQNFEDAWESNKINGITPLEELITEDDFNALIPISHRTAGHDKDGTYYTWENFVEASRYFPKFLNEGTKEDRYRELAALLGNKGQEVGGSLGPASTTEDKWNANLYWIVEIGALAGIVVKSNEDIYKAFSNHYTQVGHAEYPAVEGKSYHGRGPVQLSWNYNYGRMSEVLFGDKNILLENPNLVAREGVLGWASAIWFWMEPQGVKPSCHDVMVGNVDLSEPYTVPIGKSIRSARTHTVHSKGHKADGTPVSYEKLNLGLGLEVGFGMTINIINGGLESNGGLGGFDNRQSRRIAFYARYLDYFGTVKKGRDDGADLPISPQIRNVNGVGGDPVPDETIALFKEWRNWRYLPQDGTSPDGTKDFPKEEMPSIMASHYMESLR